MKEKIIRFGPQLRVAIVCLLSLGVGVGALHRSHSAFTTAGKVQQRTASVQFVIADLDGDRKPDLALVEAGNPRWANCNYSIRLQFSAGPDSAIGVRAPRGGLQVAARDVNGDDSVDLIVTANLDEGFVEVLLNDGHGNFSVAEPGAYRELKTESHLFLNGPSGPVTDRATIASMRSSFGQASVHGCDGQQILSSDSFRFASDQTELRPPVRSHLGRSPPSLATLS
ncbi:MAG: hypothetical protein WBL63_14230 [Candidatus Acidiferrum sp.]